MKAFNVLVIKDYMGDGAWAWSAQCLEHDIAAQGNSVEEALTVLAKTFIAEEVCMRQLGKTLEDIPEAPREYWNIFKNGAKLDTEAVKPSIPENFLPEPHMIPQFAEARVA